MIDIIKRPQVYGEIGHVVDQIVALVHPRRVAAVFAAVYMGLRTEALLRWSKREVVWAKAALGVFFVGMAGAILWL